MYATVRLLSNLPEGSSPGAGPYNQFNHARDILGGDFTGVVRPNFDTVSHQTH